MTLLTRPRRSSKTLLMSMTQQFLDIEHAEEHRKLFEGLQVMDDPVAMKEQVTRPVVFLTLRDHYGKNAVLLIDEYDAPLQSAWSHGYYDEAID